MANNQDFLLINGLRVNGAVTSGISVTAPSFVGSLTGNASTASMLSMPVSGDVSIPANSLTATLANTGVAAGTYNNVTVNTKGLVTAASNVAYLTANQNITVTGDATGSGTTSIPLTLAASGVTPGTYSDVTVDAKGRVTSGLNTIPAMIAVYRGNVGQMSGTSLIPLSNSVPLNTQGTFVASVTITPTKASSDILIAFTGITDNNQPNVINSLAVFRGSTFIGMGMESTSKSGGLASAMQIELIDHPNTTSPVTYTFRIGTTAGTWYLGRDMTYTEGGTNTSTWTIKELS